LALKAQIQQVEEMVQAQTLQLKSDMKSDMASSQTKLQSDIKEQLEDFFTKLVRLQSGTPPPQVVTTEAAASNLGQLSNRHSVVGENSPLSNAFSVSPVYHMQFSKSGPSNPHRPNPPPPIKTTKPPQPMSHLTPLPDNPQFGMPTSLLSGLNMGTYSSATAPSTTHSLSFQPQFPPTPPP
jgi:hypothetical protein